MNEQNESADIPGRVGTGLAFAAIVSAVAGLFQLANVVTAIVAIAVAATIYGALRSVPRSARLRWLPWAAAAVVLLAIAGTVYLLRLPKPVPLPNPVAAATASSSAAPPTVAASPSFAVPAATTTPTGTRAPSRVPSASSSAPVSVEATFALAKAEYIDVDLGRIVVQDSQDLDASDYQIEPGTITPRGHARLAPQDGDEYCANRQGQDGRLRQFSEGPFCGTSGAVAPAVPRYFTLEIVAFHSGLCTIRVTYR